VRYVLDGKGTVTIDDDQQQNVGPGSLVEVSGPAALVWETSSEMLVLTPGFEEGGKLIAVALVLVVLCGSLIAGVGG
jgi:quercetin dioxygenase-like cupin family protein